MILEQIVVTMVLINLLETNHLMESEIYIKVERESGEKRKMKVQTDNRGSWKEKKQGRKGGLKILKKVIMKVFNCLKVKNLFSSKSQSDPGSTRTRYIRFFHVKLK